MELTLRLNDRSHDMLFSTVFFLVCRFATLATLALKTIDGCKRLKKEEKAMLVYIYCILV